MGLKKAAAAIRSQKPKSTRGWKPKVTAIVVQKRVSAKFLKANDLSSVPPGSVVDRNVVSQHYWDFYLTTCGAPVGGTALPTRYIVALNEFEMALVRAIRNKCFLSFMFTSDALCKGCKPRAYRYGAEQRR